MYHTIAELLGVPHKAIVLHHPSFREQQKSAALLGIHSWSTALAFHNTIGPGCAEIHPSGVVPVRPVQPLDSRGHIGQERRPRHLAVQQPVLTLRSPALCVQLTSLEPTLFNSRGSTILRETHIFEETNANKGGPALELNFSLMKHLLHWAVPSLERSACSRQSTQVCLTGPNPARQCLMFAPRLALRCPLVGR